MLIRIMGIYSPVHYLKPNHTSSQELGDVCLAVVVRVELVAPVERRPLGLLLEEAHGLDVL